MDQSECNHKYEFFYFEQKIVYCLAEIDLIRNPVLIKRIDIFKCEKCSKCFEKIKSERSSQVEVDTGYRPEWWHGK